MYYSFKKVGLKEKSSLEMEKARCNKNIKTWESLIGFLSHVLCWLIMQLMDKKFSQSNLGCGEKMGNNDFCLGQAAMQVQIFEWEVRYKMRSQEGEAG